MDKNCITLMSLNVNGLNDPDKRCRFASTHLYCKFSPAPDIFCLQEMCTNPESEEMFLMQWQHDLAFSHVSTRHGGLITGFRRSLDYSVSGHYELKEENVGQALLVLAQIQEIEMLIVNIYMWPVASKPQFDSFLMQLQIEIEDLGCPNVICCGDFNAVMDNTKDRTAAGLHPTRTLTGFAKSTELIDTFRVFNPLSRRVTYFAKSVCTGRRLDYIFASGFFMNLIRNAAILPRSFSNHNPTTLELCLHRNPKGPGY